MNAATIIPFLWAGTGLVSLFAIVIMIYWAAGRDQFNEEIKNQIFSKDDDDRYGKTRSD